MPWKPLPLSYAVAIYPFQPSDSPAELPLQIGDQLYVIEQGGKDGAWCRGYLVAPPSLLSSLSQGGHTAADARVFSGVFPRCCIEIREELGASVTAPAVTGESEHSKPPAPVPMLKIGDETATSLTEPLIDEISSCLREWYILHLPELVLQRQYDLLDQMSAITTRLDYARRELLNDVLTTQERMGVRNQAVWDLVRGNKMLGGEVIVRDPKQQGRLLTSHDSAIEMAKLQSVMSLLDEAPVEKIELPTLHHCLLEVKSAVGSDLDATTLNLSLYERTPNGDVSPFSETFTSLASSKSKTLLADLAARDIGSDNSLFLVVKVITSEPIRTGPKVQFDNSLTRNGTLRGSRDSLLTRRRSSLMFGSKRLKERPRLGPNARFAQRDDKIATPSIQEEGEEESTPKVSSGPPVPRTMGIGVVDIGRIVRTGAEETANVTIWAASAREEGKPKEWDALIPNLLQSQSGMYGISPKVSQVQFLMTPFKSPDVETLIKNNPTSMHMVDKTQKIGFSEAPSKKRSDIYLTLSRIKIPQGGHLSHPEVGFAPIRATNLSNLQLTMEVRDSSGRRIEQCIHVSSNSVGVTAFRTLATELGTAWDQTVCLRLPTEKVSESHLVLSVADAQEFPFALAWMPLWNENAFVTDGMHNLILHAYDKSTSSIVQGRGAYLSLKWNLENFVPAHEGPKPLISSLEVETKLCSTEFSQDRILVTLMQWKHQTSNQLRDLLHKVVFVPEIEIVKQLNDVLDALFAILVHKSGESKFEDLIFNDIVFVLGIVHDRRYNLGPLVEQYAEDHFHSPHAALSLVRSFTRLLQSVSDPQSARDMRALFKVGKQFMKLLLASHQQAMAISSPNASRSYSNFKEDMQAVLFGLQMLMRSETAALVGSKTILIQNFHTWLPELLVTFSKDEVIRVAINFVDSSEYATGKLVLYRILLILNYVKLDQIWTDSKDRAILIKNCIRWLDPYWQTNDLTDDWQEQVRLCTSVVAELCQQPTSLLYDFMPSIIDAYCYIAADPSPKRRTLSLLFSDHYPFTQKQTESNDQYDEPLIELAAVLSTISRMKPPHTLKLEHQDLSNYILSSLAVLRSLLNHHACPPTWLSFHIYIHQSALEIFEYLSKLLIGHFIPNPEDAEAFDMQLWKAYFDTLLSLVCSPSLTLESFPEQKRRAVWKIAGDVRQSGADLLRYTWESLGWEATTDDQRRYNIHKLGGYQVQYVPSLVAPIVELCLSMHEGLRRVAVEILQTMIVSEWALSEDLDLIETEMIGALNTALRTKSVSANEAMSRKLFISELLELFATIANQPDDALWTSLEELVGTVEELIDLLTNTENDEDEEEEMMMQKHHSKHAARQRKLDTEGEMEKARRSIDGLSPGRDVKEYGTQALECYKQLAEEYERNGDYKRLAKTYRAIARIHEARAASRVGMNGHDHADSAGVDED